MGRNIPAGQEAQALRRLIRDARTAAKELSDVIDRAAQLTERLVSEFQAVADREVRQFSNQFTEESNRLAASLNAEVEHARAMIVEEIMAGELLLDPERNLVTFQFGATRFDDRQPLPYPSTPPKEDHQ